jgi:FdhE protein
MHGTTSSVRADGRLSAAPVAPSTAADFDPAWRPWVRLLDLALSAADDPAWAEGVPEPSRDRSLGTPLLEGTEILVDARRVRGLLRMLLREASADTGPRSGGVPDDPTAAPRSRRLDAVGVLRAAIVQDGDAIEHAAVRAGVEPGPLSAVAQLAAIPVLRACAVRLRDRIPETWLQGYCPVCAAWPTLVEIRGLERNRRLRCARCSTDWPIPVLRCPFCSEIHHDKLHALLPEGSEQTRRVDVCDSCKGYIKGFSTLQSMPLRSLATTDLATIELDLVAQERGYARPSHVAYPLALTVTRATARTRTTDPS